MSIINRFLGQRCLFFVLACFTINYAYAENINVVKSPQAKIKTNAPIMSSQQLLVKMKNLNTNTFPGKKVTFRQLPTKAQREIQRSYDKQARRQTQACASKAPSTNVNDFANATKGGTQLDCAIGEIAIGCWHGDDKFTGCQLLGDEWACQWNETDPQGC